MANVQFLMVSRSGYPPRDPTLPMFIIRGLWPYEGPPFYFTGPAGGGETFSCK